MPPVTQIQPSRLQVNEWANTNKKLNDMVKAEMIKAMSERTGVAAETTIAVVEEFMNVVKRQVASGDEVTLRGFGTFKNVHRNEKKFNYAPGKTRMIPEHYEVMLKYSKEVKNAVK